MSTYNVELVHVILKAVSEYTVGTPKSENYLLYQDYDFTSKHEFTIDSITIHNAHKWQTGVNAETLTLTSDIRVTEWSPDIFAHLRHLDGKDRTESGKSFFEQSLAPENNIDMVFKAGESQGKSGSFFFFSKDRHFIIKTMTNSDFHAF
jgi:hypothetical protein